MEGLVSLLDAEHDALTRALWEELEAALGLRGVWATPYPHFSYQIAPSYEGEALAEAAQALARSAAPFEVRTAGLGLFTGPEPVLYLPVVRTAALSAWQAQVWAAALPAARDPVPYYQPDQWAPHITLAQGDLTPGRVAEAARLLAGREFHWTIEVDNLSFIGEVGTAQELRWRWALEGRAAHDLLIQS
jgi:2'-5' RNA ligase